MKSPISWSNGLSLCLTFADVHAAAGRRYDLKQLFISSEGTLGVLTVVALACPPLPAAVEALCVACPDWPAVLAVRAA